MPTELSGPECFEAMTWDLEDVVLDGASPAPAACTLLAQECQFKPSNCLEACFPNAFVRQGALAQKLTGPETMKEEKTLGYSKGGYISL